ncbi:hypothetical protein [uncultured Phenylobacterium sp.]|uniref:hypothetical protein n=1 Tax=uncultured Phenylobacterium sp. TaxID=349273 RepID=UPI0025D13D21|nr:hypothetical protein [uncultured Phenylobacterium sp.]
MRTFLLPCGFAALMAAALAEAGPGALPSTSVTTTYRRALVDGVGVFYREAGPSDAPTIVMLHGYAHRRACTTV